MEKVGRNLWKRIKIMGNLILGAGFVKSLMRLDGSA